MSRVASREPASLPLAGRLSRADLLWVANTAHGPGAHWHARPRDGAPDHDHLTSPEAAVEYLVAHRVAVPDPAPDAAALAALATVRSMVERLLSSAGDPIDEAGRSVLAAARFEIGTDGAIRSAASGWRGFCEDLLVPLLALLPDRAHLSRCSNPACRLVFEDGSRNHGRRWCDAAGCGNRDRVRRARGRGRSPAPS